MNMIDSSTIKNSVTSLIGKYSGKIPLIEIELLLCRILKCAREDIYVCDHTLSRDAEDLYDEFVRRRLAGEPLQYIIGKADFMGINFVVNKDVFIPRPETELLVEAVLSLVSGSASGRKEGLKILDLCTGCGNIGISLAMLIPGVEVIAVDISEAALEIARKNSLIHRVDKSITFYKGSLFHAIPVDKKNKFDIIVCNPPYIKKGELDSLQKEVRYEPAVALDGGADGLEMYREIAKYAPGYLRHGGSLFLELGFGQSRGTIELFSEDIYKIREVKKDFSGIERVLWIDLL